MMIESDKKNLLINEIENYLMSIVDTSLKYIPHHLKGEYIANIHSITMFHKNQIDLLIKNKVDKND